MFHNFEVGNMKVQYSPDNGGTRVEEPNDEVWFTNLSLGKSTELAKQEFKLFQASRDGSKGSLEMIEGIRRYQDFLCQYP